MIPTIHLARKKADPLGRVGRSKRPGRVIRRLGSDTMREHHSKMGGVPKSVTVIVTFLPVILPVRPPPVKPCLPIGSVDPGGRIPWRMLRCLVSAVKQLYLLDPPPSPPAPPAEPDEKEVMLPASHSSGEIEWGDALSLQVSVIIAMPTQERCGSSREVYPEWVELGEICIGTMDMPQSGGG